MTSREERIEAALRAALEAHDGTGYATNEEYSTMDDALSQLKRALAAPPEPREQEPGWPGYPHDHSLAACVLDILTDDGYGVAWTWNDERAGAIDSIVRGPFPCKQEPQPGEDMTAWYLCGWAISLISNVDAGAVIEENSQTVEWRQGARRWLNEIATRHTQPDAVAEAGKGEA